jgi:hypothetical protein
MYFYVHVILICNLGAGKDQEDTGGVVVVHGDIYILWTHLELVLRSRKCGSVHPLSHSPS